MAPYLSKLITKVSSVSINIPKNILQFFVGVVIYMILLSSKINALLILEALTAFLLIYNSVYLFNDIMDYKEDKKHPLKRKIKPIARGDLTIENAAAQMLIFLIIGFILSSLVGKYFTIFLAVLLFLNFLFSSKYTRFKKNILRVPTLFLIEFLKFSIGWFAITNNLSRFPFVFIGALSAFYTAGYLMYKNLDLKLDDFVKKREVVLTFLFGVVLYFLSIFLYPFRFPMILLIILFISALSVVMVLRYYNIEINKVEKRWIGEKTIVLLSMALIVLLLISLSTPSVSKINNKISAPIDKTVNGLANKSENFNTVYCYLNGSFFERYNVTDLEQIDKKTVLKNK